jgi:hypothetical protein
MENKIEITPTPNINLAVFKTASSLTDEDKAKVREYSKLVKAREQLALQQQKIDEMLALIGEKWCKGYLWTNKNGDVVPVFDIDDDYLKNIVNWCKRYERDIPKEIKKEYYARFGYTDFGSNADDKFTPKKTTRADKAFGLLRNDNEDFF